MSESELKKMEKNLKLSVEFQEYILKHPDILDALPRNSKIILDEDTSEMKKNNVFRAVKRKGEWQLLSAST
ncbi:hypothetical protein A3H65_03110 [Candidatus Giovannonibacteria bacterium RIFCSPLOWO2_02_FULL_45_14]|uniref:Uncharacterized protein n=1 Tax=Candidatus Giovannonibacteria bacterium RIFCSPLOWO2_12_FULL_44_15 TaxID=1798364 RepID=A0A1F5Y188_9BACT|nr:MAG: hypothetical protein A3C75_00095 [Candidatus Giovannonibacteria bacterium RIFCSPHIGHO2_02_FULL_44_31]OGF75919.1 MAG: hypothetical protein A3E62_00415 [Candidatus Giovannonibacteria bacterium RIFCSPHIGHO2_12_FULL_44_29]OGF90787.1 MAG: hypothetical protein A3H65_03110 [Candidatus Giovannonibacteria bacterium RIFCSPLOWO2_02_FULL_45_14]OGF93842.1 MAG: hypothetical protein A3G54_03725 [Candidatus Giovannonibacteria bacterium RIFCSPLOWO2_12_FULL_44_15]